MGNKRNKGNKGNTQKMTDSTVSLFKLRKALMRRAAERQTRGIYGLIDPRSKLIRYVGQSEHIEMRFVQHVGRPRHGHRIGSSLSARTRWIFDVMNDGRVPELVILEEILSGDMTANEIKWIQSLELSDQADLNRVRK